MNAQRLFEYLQRREIAEKLVQANALESATEAMDATTGLAIEPILVSSENLETLATIDAVVLGHRRDADHAWLCEDRHGYFYYRDGRPIGYGYIGSSSGPFALLNAGDFPAVLALAEREAAMQGHDKFGIEVPLVNRAAVDYLLSRGYQMDQFITLFMCDEPFGRFENYLCTSPPFFL